MKLGTHAYTLSDEIVQLFGMEALMYVNCVDIHYAM